MNYTTIIPLLIQIFLLPSTLLSDELKSSAPSHVKNIAVIQLSASGIDDSEAKALTDALRTEIITTGSYDVMERSKMKEILQEQDFQMSDACDQSSCAVEIGQLLAVRYIVLGNVGLVGNTYSINVRMVDVQSSKIIREVNEYHKGKRDDLLTKVIPIIAGKITGVYKKPKNKKGFWIAGASLVAAIAVAAPVVYFSSKNDDNPENPTTELRIQWHE